MLIPVFGLNASLRISRFAAVPLILLLAAAPATAQPGLAEVDPDRTALLIATIHLIATIRANDCAMTDEEFGDEVEPILVGLEYDQAEFDGIVSVLVDVGAIGFDYDYDHDEDWHHWTIFLSEEFCAADPAQDAALFAAAADPQGRYEILESERDVVRDAFTGLEWQRCSLGQSWNGQTCTGDAARYTWEEAEQAADEVAGWRLPTIDELRMLVYCSSSEPARFPGGKHYYCESEYQRPAIVLEVFANTPVDWYWSGSYNRYGASYYAWSVDFDNGSATEYTKQSDRGRVRLVRGAQ